jgi:hypothetical protein
MPLDSRELAKVYRIIGLAEDLTKDSNNAGKTRIRRTGKELARFRRLLKSERNKGVPVSVLARRHRVSSAYIYMLP